ncbi:MAG: hypothetical protein QN172_03060 [Armatimonadota bacterium]|nr:hypothetical protein [Armatimonadota bacterium]
MCQQFSGLNAGYVAELYERYRHDPASVDAQTRAFFEQLPPAPDGVLLTLDSRVLAGAIGLAQAIRVYGHLAARLDPLGTPPPGDPSLSPESWDVTGEDLRHLPSELVGGPMVKRARNALEALALLRTIYSGAAGYEFDHLRVAEERIWLREAVEGGCFRPPQDPLDEVALLHRLTEVETFERFLHRTFPGKTRFSIKGLDILVPMLDEVIVLGPRRRARAPSSWGWPTAAGSTYLPISWASPTAQSSRSSRIRYVAGPSGTTSDGPGM